MLYPIKQTRQRTDDYTLHPNHIECRVLGMHGGLYLIVVAAVERREVGDGYSINVDAHDERKSWKHVEGRRYSRNVEARLERELQHQIETKEGPYHDAFKELQEKYF